MDTQNWVECVQQIYIYIVHREYQAEYNELITDKVEINLKQCYAYRNVNEPYEELWL